MSIILYSFGIIYAWVELDNPGRMFGAGVVRLVISAVLCGVAGFFGRQIYDWYQQLQERDGQQERVRQYREFIRCHFGQALPPAPLYHVPANGEGDVVLHVNNQSPEAL